MDNSLRWRSRNRRIGALLVGLALTGVIAASASEFIERRDARFHSAARLTGGDPESGRVLLRRFGCASCHTIPGVDGARGRIGPPLEGIASRAYIGGVLENDPEKMVHWLLDPKSIDSKTAMPDVGLSEVQARHVAAYLYTLR